jgi:hypothetical protein
MLTQLADTPLENLERLQKQSIAEAKWNQSYSAALGRVISHRKRNP